MKTCRVHIMGASGAGVSSLGRALAEVLAVPHHDTDDYYWRPTTPLYREKREVADRLQLMREVFLDRPDWILSGSLDGWGAPVVALFDLVVFVYLPTAIRLERLRAREARRLGAVADGGSMNPAMEEFLEWASHYDDGTREGRNLARHQAWLATLPCAVLRLDGTRPMPELVQQVCLSIDEQSRKMM